MRLAKAIDKLIFPSSLAHKATPRYGTHPCGWRLHCPPAGKACSQTSQNQLGKSIAHLSFSIPKQPSSAIVHLPCNSNAWHTSFIFIGLMKQSQAPMGALCSVNRGGHAPDEAPDQAYSQDSAHLPRLITKKMSPSLTEKITRQKMREINGETTYTSVENYEETRALLIAKENSQAFDWQAVATASTIEKRANELVAAIRNTDEEEIYGKLKDRHGRKRDPAHHFLGNVDLINQTELFKVAKRMPKGAHLHCHFNSCLRPEFLLGHARGRESMYIRSTCPLTKAGS
jgi:hypothetical protein